MVEEEGGGFSVGEGEGEEFGVGSRDEAFDEAEVEGVVGGAGYAAAFGGLGRAVCAVAAAGTLDETHVGVNGGDDVAALEGGKCPGLELGDVGGWRCAGWLHLE